MKEIILRPILSEKSLMGAEAGKYVFVVAKSANKHTISETLKNVYKVDTIKVNIMNSQPETKIRRGHKTQVRSIKKAIVTLKKGQKIEGFEFTSDKA